MPLEAIRIKIAEILGINIISNKYLFIDIWSIVHLISGIILMILIMKFFKKAPTYFHLILLMIFLIFYEVGEAYIYTNKDIFNGFIRTETIADTIWDVIFGILGGISYKSIYSIVRRKK